MFCFNKLIEEKHFSEVGWVKIILCSTSILFSSFSLKAPRQMKDYIVVKRKAVMVMAQIDFNTGGETDGVGERGGKC